MAYYSLIAYVWAELDCLQAANDACPNPRLDLYINILYEFIPQ
jgi:hypothetical protein